LNERQAFSPLVILMLYQPAFPRSPTPAPWRHQSYPSSHAPKRGRDFRSWPLADVEIAARGRCPLSGGKADIEI